jgi:hypothetical protein
MMKKNPSRSELLQHLHDYAFVASAKRGREADAAWGYVLSEGA